MYAETNKIIIDEIENTLKLPKNSTTAASGNLLFDILKTDSSKVGKMQHKLLMRICNDYEILKKQKEGAISKIPKKRDLSKCEKWRAIIFHITTLPH